MRGTRLVRGSLGREGLLARLELLELWLRGETSRLMRWLLLDGLGAVWDLHKIRLTF